MIPHAEIGDSIPGTTTRTSGSFTRASVQARQYAIAEAHPHCMMYILAAILAASWFGLVVTANMLGGYVHLLLMLAFVVVIGTLVYEGSRS